jgi:hypothetical protein
MDPQKHNKHPTLPANVLSHIKRELANGVKQHVIAKELGVTKAVITNIAGCIAAGHPIEDYQLIYGKGYRYSPVNESGQFHSDSKVGGVWDVRMGLKLLSVSFAKWPQALAGSDA